ncbi:hypothetical protein DFH09DRAFT_1242201 [Mycena vulgaris]|nr:hypothetical protein DFH09DRAFT_1242201 [Mycena vulgaris]
MLPEPPYSLPTLDILNTALPSDLDVRQVAVDWISSFASCVEAGDTPGLMALFIQESHWRDMLVLTWDFRSFHGAPRIKKFLEDRLIRTHVTNICVQDQFTALERPYPDIAWIRILSTFQTDVGLASGTVRLVPQGNRSWKAYCMYTNLEDLKGFPEQIGSLRNGAPNHGKWSEERRNAMSFDEEDPTVLVIGGGHSGLDIAARLKYLDVRTLVIEKNERIGDNWRNRYDALCLHDPVWFDHMPYMPFPPTWPVYTPALKLANWLEHYAEALELNVWTSSIVVSARQDSSGAWNVVVHRSGKERAFKVRHLIFATGIGAGEGSIPSYPGMDRFKGTLLHSTQHKRATDHAGKKIVVIGACTSGHDIAADYHTHGVDVTIYQRSSTYVMSSTNGWGRIMKRSYWEDGPPVDVADRLAASFPHLMAINLNRRQAIEIAEDDQRLNMGDMDAGLVLLARGRAGGYYIDVGASQLIIDRKIKLKNDSQISEFTERGLKFEDGSELYADVAVFATGLGDARNGIHRICGDAVADKCKPIWGLDAEGEIQGASRDLDVPGLWYMIGNLALCRFHSKHVALQIKAMEEKVFGARYSPSQPGSI